MPDALRQVRESTADRVTRLSFEVLVLTAARSGEVRLAMWEEMELESSTWKVPLTGRALEILSQARELDGQDSGLVFPAGNRKPLSDMVYTALLRRLGIPAVPHGFRSSFKDWCMEVRVGDDRWFLSEAALAHNLGDATETAYARTDLLEPRRPLMDEWAEFLQAAQPSSQAP